MPFPSSRKILAAAALAAMASGAQSAVVYSLANDGMSLIRFDSATPGMVTSLGAVSGAVSRLDGLDFRPADGFLYGYSRSTSDIYRVEANGATTFVSSSTVPMGTNLLGIDFNPVPDRLRLVTVDDENRRINVDTGATTIDGTLAYAATDVNAGISPNLIDAGYTFSDRNSGTGTTLYYIDYVLNTLVTTSAPNGGTLNTVGLLGVDTSRFTGFDIFTDSNGVNTAFASLQVDGGVGVGVVDGLYTINLLTGNATPLGAIGASDLFGLAVAVPEPGSLALVAAAGLAAFGVRRRGAVRAAPPAHEGVAAV